MNRLRRWFTPKTENDADDGQNPWAGLASYEDPATAERKLKFCGRDDDSYDVAKLIMGNIFVTIYGKSGIGKTSLLNAGVFPELREEQYSPLSLRLGIRDDDTTQSYQTAIIDAVNRAVRRIEEIDVIPVQEDQQCVDYLRKFFASHRFYDKDDNPTIPVVVFDQFEEVFRNNREEAETLLRQLDNCAVNGSSHRYEISIRFVISIREDDLYRLEDSIDNCYLPSLKRCRYRLHSLSEQGARDAILIPGEGLFGEDEKERIAQTIIQISRNKKDKSISTNLLSLVCSRLYVESQNTSSSFINLSLVDSFVKDNPFERFYNEATRGFSNREKSYFEEHFVDSTGRRNSIPESDFLIHVKNGAKLIDGKNRILQRTGTSTDGRNARIELIHDSFCEPLEKMKDKRKQRKRYLFCSLVILIIITICLAAFSFIKISQSNKKLNISQSRLIAGMSLRLADEGDTYLAQMIALQALPPIRTYTQEAEDALRYALSNKIAKIYGHTRDVISAHFSPDGKHVVSASTDGIIRIWDTTNGLCVKTLERQYENFNFAEYTPDGRFIITTSDNGRACLWDVETWNIVKTFLNERLEYRKIISACLSPDGKYFAFVPLSDKTIQVYGLSTDNYFYKELKTISDINSVAFNPDGKNIVAATSSGKIEIWDWGKGECVNTLDATSTSYNSVCYSPDGKSIVTASVDSLVRIWNVESGKCTKMLRGHNGPVLSASYSHDGKYVVSSSKDGTVRIWVGEHRVLEGHNGIVFSASFSPDDKYVVSASGDQTIGLWCLNVEESIFKTSPNSLRYSNFSPDGKHVICRIKDYDSSDKYALCIWDIESNECVDTLHGHTQQIKSALYSNDGKYIVSASADGTIRVWEVVNGNCIKVIGDNQESFSYATFSPNGRYILSISTTQTLRLWDCTSSECVYTLKDFAKYATFAPDNKYFATASDSCIYICDVSTGERQLKIVQPVEIHSVSYSPDGMYIVTALGDGTINILNAQTGKLIKTFNDHEHINYAVFNYENYIDECANFASFSSDGNYIVSSYSDYKSSIHTVQIWGVSTGVCVKSLRIGARAYSAVFSPDNKHIATFALTNSQIWSFPPLQELIDETRERFKNRQLTPEERRKYYLE